MAKEKLTFEGLGLPEELMAATRRGGYRESTPLQVEVIPVALEGRDILGVAGIATGRTLAFGLPMVKRVREKGGVGLVLLPEKKVAEQVLKRFERIGRALELKTALASKADDAKEAGPAKEAEIVVGLPDAVLARLNDGTLDPGKVVALAVDEIDFILERGHRETLAAIVGTIPKDRQTFVFGKRLPGDAAELTGMNDPYTTAAAEPEWRRKKRSRDRESDGEPKSYLPKRPWRGIPDGETLEESVAIAVTEIWPGEKLPGMDKGANKKRGRRRRRR